MTIQRQQRQQTNESIAFFSDENACAHKRFAWQHSPPRTGFLRSSAPLDSEGWHGDSPPEAGFLQSRRASPEAHGSGSDSPACAGVLQERLGVAWPLQRQETTPAGATIRFQSTLHHAHLARSLHIDYVLPWRQKTSQDLARGHWGCHADRAVDDDLCRCIGLHLLGLGGGGLHPRQRQGRRLNPLGLGGWSLHRLHGLGVGLHPLGQAGSLLKMLGRICDL